MSVNPQTRSVTIGCGGTHGVVPKMVFVVFGEADVLHLPRRAGRRGPARRSPASRYRWFPKRNARRRSGAGFLGGQKDAVVLGFPVPRKSALNRSLRLVGSPTASFRGPGQVTATAGPRRGPFDLPLVGERGPFSFRPERRTLHRVDGPFKPGDYKLTAVAVDATAESNPKESR